MSTHFTPADPVFAGRIEQARRVTIPSALGRCRETGRIDAFKLEWKEGMPNRPHIFWDSDTAKVLEGMALMLELHPEDQAAAAELEKLVDLVVSAQQPDGYLNTHFTVVNPEGRWSNLYDWHELYCAGHLMEAAVAHFRATGRRTFLDAMCRYADYIGSVFGDEPGKRRGCPGHEEIELALCKLADATGEAKYLKLANYFLRERGREPNTFLEEKGTAAHRGSLVNRQAHRPVREQTEAVGHSVRALYLYTGMVDVAARNGDKTLLAAAETLFASIADSKMYITGGCGSTPIGEAFTEPYDLPLATVYAESCAAMALVQLARRLSDATGKGKYADVMEQTLYNGALSGISLSGDRYFYANPMEVDASFFRHGHTYSERQPWFSCSCCPTSYSRFLPQIGDFCFTRREGEVYCRIPAAGRFSSPEAEIEVSGRYPYDGEITFDFRRGGEFTFAVRIPGWCRRWSARLNGETVTEKIHEGRLTLRRAWKAGDRLELSLELAVEMVRADLRVNACHGKAALMRGPLVYALESVDNGPGVTRIILPPDPEFVIGEATGLSGVPAITGKAWRELPSTGGLYRRNTPPPEQESFVFTAIPYALWQNRGPAELTVWIPALV